jgi:hypothetical protein
VAAQQEVVAFGCSGWLIEVLTFWGPGLRSMPRLLIEQNKRRFPRRRTCSNEVWTCAFFSRTVGLFADQPGRSCRLGEELG